MKEILSWHSLYGFADWQALRDSPRKTRRYASRGRRAGRRLSVERLEDRTLLALDFGLAFSIGGSDIRPDSGAAITVDEEGNQYLQGSFYDTIDMDPGPGQVLLTSASAGKSDLFVAKYDPAGGLLWANRMGGPESDLFYGSDLAVDAAGNAYVTGMLRGTADFGGFALTSQGLSDIFIAKLAADGNFLWTTRLGASNDTVNLEEEGFGVATDDLGNVYTTGRIFNGVSGTQISVAKHDTSGNLVWLNALGEFGSGGGQGNDLALDAAGNVYVTGSFGGRVDFDPGQGTYNLSVPNFIGYGDAFVLKLNAGGNFVWAGRMGGDNHDTGNGIAVDGAGQVHVVGDFYSTSIDVHPGEPQVSLANAGSSDVFVVKFDANRNLLWARSIGGPGAELGPAIGVDGAGDVYVAGSFGETVDFDPRAASFNLTSAGNADGFVSRLDSAGNFVWAGQIAGPSLARPNDLALDSAGNVYLTGVFYGTADFDPGPGEYLLHSILDSNGSARGDAFVAKLIQAAAPPPPATSLTINDVSVSEGNSGSTTATFTVTRSGDTTQEVTVAYATADGTATAGSDYQVAAGAR